MWEPVTPQQVKPQRVNAIRFGEWPMPFSAKLAQLVPYRSLPRLLLFDFGQEERGLLSV
jgi:hypothetical protein